MSQPRHPHPPRSVARFKAMRWIDHWVGLPACFALGLLLTAARRVLPARDRRISGERAIAVFKFFGLGSILQATPLLRAVRRHYPRSRLAVVTFDVNEPLLRRLDLNADIRVIRTSGALAFATDVVAHVLWSWRNGVEAVIDLEFFSKFSTLLALFSGARVRVGFHLNDFWRRSLVTHPIYFNYFRHITDIYTAAARQIGVEIDDASLSRIAFGPESMESVERSLAGHGWRPDMRLIGVNANAGEMSLERRWPVERFAAVIETLLRRRPDLFVALTGSPSERPHVESLRALLPPDVAGRVAVTAGEWSLDEFAAALTRCVGFLTNDSGPMHMAAAQGVPGVSLWGPGRPEFYAPRTANHRALYANYPCSPCLYMFTAFEGMWCRHEGWCMREIQVESVVEAVESVLADEKPQGFPAIELPPQGRIEGT